MSAIRTISRLHSRVETLEKEREHLLDAAKDVIASASDTYKKRNGHLASFEDDSGEKCWIVPFDAFESLRSAVDAITTNGQDYSKPAASYNSTAELIGNSTAASGGE